VGVASEHFVSKAVVKVPASHALKIRSVRFTSAVTNVRSGLKVVSRLLHIPVLDAAFNLGRLTHFALDEIDQQSGRESNPRLAILSIESGGRFSSVAKEAQLEEKS